MKNSFPELVNYIADMTAEARGIQSTIEYLKNYLFDESPRVAEDIRQLETELAEVTEAMERGIAYRARLAAY